MGTNTIRRNIRNSELAVSKDKRAFLTYPMDGLAACTLEENEDGIVLSFDTVNLESADTVLSRSQEDRLRFLVNCAALNDLYAEYDFSLSPDNLLIDLNLRPKVLKRDAKRHGDSEFLSRYKALIGSMLQKRYKYEDYLSGGNGLYKKNKLLTALTALDTVEEIRGRLFSEYQKAVRKTRETKKLVSKQNALASRIAIPILAVALAVSAFFMWQALFQDIPFKDSVIEANTYYIASNYLGAQRSLEKYDVNDLSTETKYILSRAYVSTEALKDVEKENILIGLTMKTDPIIFDYWILLGRLDFDEAIDIAQRLGDDELLLFAYLKYQVAVRNDTTMSGEDKTKLINDLDGKIANLVKARDAASGGQ